MSNANQYWALPDGINEALPIDAARLERLRRELLDLYATWGYQLVMPPMVEYLESLRIAQGTDLDLQTFKVTDQLNGRMMGVRADMTPQVARMDAHRLRANEINRLCYIGTVLRTKSFHRDGSRAPLQVGAELFGHAGIDSDVEILALLIQTLMHCHVPDILLGIGHVEIFSGLVAQAKLDEVEQKHYLAILERKSLPELDQWLAKLTCSDEIRAMLHALPRLYGGVEVLQDARNALQLAQPNVLAALDYLQQIVETLQRHYPTCRIHIDLAELSGYSYHTGIVYAAYTPGTGSEIARGGRYDGIGEAFGRSRPATGFSTNLHELVQYLPAALMDNGAILAPATQDPALDQAIAQLRLQGECVIRALAGQVSTAAELGLTRQLVYTNGQWILNKV
ncbi:ATP phosphoribosyltransferase regulatory subunit [Thiofilum flexile]|uniref:ATP phosphoribosyltransferase regulatory subunit n=1 Tax=Thiofilum flexile TaxID=125627 RepID=UPI00036E3AB6|nr:ATP phosphoribosyltransferase regulatory subunit [Thiofilum flexile]